MLYCPGNPPASPSIHSFTSLTHLNAALQAACVGAIPDPVTRQSHDAVKYLRSSKLGFLTYKMDLTPHFKCVGKIWYRGKKSRTECWRHTETPFCVMTNTSRKKAPMNSQHAENRHISQAWSPVILAPMESKAGEMRAQDGLYIETLFKRREQGVGAWSRRESSVGGALDQHTQTLSLIPSTANAGCDSVHVCNSCSQEAEAGRGSCL